MSNRRSGKQRLALLLSVVTLCCAMGVSAETVLLPRTVSAVELELPEEEIPLAETPATDVPVAEAPAAETEAAPAAMAIQPVGTAPAVDISRLTVASGVKTKKSGKAEIDYSNTADGYVMVRYTANTAKKLKALVKGPKTTYTYTLKPGMVWTTFPLSDGNGKYSVSLYENICDTRYSAVMAASFDAELKDEFGPFLRPNQYVNYAVAADKTIAKAAELCKGVTDPLKKVQVIYDYVVGTLQYNYALAATVQSGYLPVLDTVLTSKQGICFDYAALMTAMLRTQGVPCKLVVGYAGTAYHAWISVWTEQQGWVENVVYFDGTNWQRMDPTFASTGKQSPEVLKYIGDGANYTVKYLY